LVTSPELNEIVWDRLRDAGLRVTPLRRRLVTLFASSRRWYTPQELSVQARKAGLRPGRATVYRLIDALVQAGLCKSFPQNTRAQRYVFCLPGHHHHLICLDCGRVTDLENCQVKVPDVRFTVTEHSVDFFGRCASCDTTSP
jgi:Fur family transcriptional regulator, ferric uptake regulator